PPHGAGPRVSGKHFLIPGPGSGVQFQKGTYDAQEGDFSAAGAINVNYVNVLDRPLLKLEGGQAALGRALLASSSHLGRGHLLYGAEAYHDDCPWLNPNNYRKWHGVLRCAHARQRHVAG